MKNLKGKLNLLSLDLAKLRIKLEKNQPWL